MWQTCTSSAMPSTICPVVVMALAPTGALSEAEQDLQACALGDALLTDWVEAHRRDVELLQPVNTTSI